MKNFISISENLFESIKHINEYNQEYWSARELMPVLEYKQWRQFSDTIERAKKACEISGNSPSEHFANDRKTSFLLDINDYLQVKRQIICNKFDKSSLSKLNPY